MDGRSTTVVALPAAAVHGMAVLGMAVLGLAVLGLWSVPALALSPGSAGLDQPCADRARLVGALASQHAEKQTALGLDHEGRVVEIFTSPYGTWSILVTSPDGTSCLVSAGESWRRTDDKLDRHVSSRVH